MPNPASASLGRPPRSDRPSGTRPFVLALGTAAMALGLFCTFPVFGTEKARPEAREKISFGDREARHLLNRAGFGGTREQIESLSRMGLRNAVQLVLEGNLPGGLAEEPGNSRAVLVFRDNRPSIPGFENVPIKDQKEMLKTFLARNEKSKLTHVKGDACWSREKEPPSTSRTEASSPKSPAVAPSTTIEKPARNDLADALPERCPRCVLDTYSAVLTYRNNNRAQIESLRGWWVQEMIRTPRPLQEKMALFWHNYFPSSWRKGIPAEHMGLQIELFRERGLGDFRSLLQAVAKDRAMLRYLDTLENQKLHPNENFARELMELFTLGVGHYTERDVLEAARAFTGWAYDKNGFVLRRHQHDDGEKTVLGKKGNFDGEEIIDLLLEHPATAARLSTRLLDFFAGPDRPEGMDRHYAKVLLGHKWSLPRFLETLFTDPDFYRSEVVGSRISGAVESIVGTARRMQYVPPNPFVGTAAEMLGQALLEPPSVKGWDDGEAWITTSLYFWRCNIAGYLVQGVGRGQPGPRPDSKEGLDDPRASSTHDSEGKSPGILRQSAQKMTKKQIRAQVLTRETFAPTHSLRSLLEPKDLKAPAALIDGLCELLLATEMTSTSRSSLIDLAKANRREKPISDSPSVPLFSDEFLIRLARIILSLPEAQMS